MGWEGGGKIKERGDSNVLWFDLGSCELAAVHRSGQQGLANSQEIRPAAEEAVDFPETPVSHNIIAHPWGRVGWMYAVVSPCGRPA